MRLEKFRCLYIAFVISEKKQVKKDWIYNTGGGYTQNNIFVKKCIDP